MLRGTAAFVAAAGVLWHAVVGCCAHHEHLPAAPQASSCPTHRPDHAFAPGDAAEHDLHTAEPAAHQHQVGKAHEPDAAHEVEIFRAAEHAPHHDPCHRDGCSFRAAEVATTADVRTIAGPSPATMPIWIGVAERAPRGRPAPHDDPPPALRRHLALRVLLI